MPSRIQRRRKPGWTMPPGAIYVGRPTRWGNPWHVGEVIDGITVTSVDAVQLYKALLVDQSAEYRALAKAQIAGHDLACWCPIGAPCHADILLEVANADA